MYEPPDWNAFRRTYRFRRYHGKRHVPPCIYVLVGGGRVVYVGQSTNLYQRRSHHRRRMRWGDYHFDAIFYREVTEGNLYRAERAVFRALRPPAERGRVWFPPDAHDLDALKLLMQP
jgi:hypothetical protein